jgi:hypothetical protein
MCCLPPPCCVLLCVATPCMEVFQVLWRDLQRWDLLYAGYSMLSARGPSTPNQCAVCPPPLPLVVCGPAVYGGVSSAVA